MDSDQGKLFIGGISWETTEDKLKDYFRGYGDVLQAVVMRDKITRKPRGFGFVVFANPNALDAVQDTHLIDGRTVEAKRALSREEQQTSRAGNPNSSRNFGSGGNNTRTKKIFVGGLPPTLSEDGFRNYFESYGNVTDVVIMYDQQTNRPRRFGFSSFDSEEAVDRVLHKTFHEMNGKQVEVKRDLPQDSNPGAATGRSNYQGYGGQSRGSSYDDRTDSNRYVQPQNTSGGYPPYGASWYNTPGYGYGPTNNGMGYGSYGGGPNPGYGGPGAAYGNPNVLNVGYASNQPNAPRSSWGSQAPSGYGNMGYGSAPWAATNASNGGSTGTGGNAAGQSPSAAAGYGGNQAGYGYGTYGANDGGGYGNQAGYGVIGGHAGSGPNGNAPVGGAATVGDYMEGSYGDASSGYGNQGWRSDASQASGNYGPQSNGPYGGAPARQAQR